MEKDAVINVESRIIEDTEPTYLKSTRKDYNLLKWTLAIVIAILGAVYLAIKPNDYTPAFQFVLNVLLFLVAYWIGHTKDIEKAKKHANDRWLPQAESVILRLITLKGNVNRFAKSVSCSTGNAEIDLPELLEPINKAIRIKMKTDCESTTHRLVDITYQLDDAIEDWRRFIIDNCDGQECSRIFDAIQQRERNLNSV